MQYSLIQRILKVLILLTIGFLSIAFFLLKNPTNQISVSQGEINATKYGLSLQEVSGELFLFGFPLNDFYYHGFSKSHLLDKVSESKSGGPLEEFLIALKDIFLNEKDAKLVFKGNNREGSGEIDYTVKYSDNRMEIERKISLSKNFDAIGQSIVVCSGCFITDDRGRIYLNQGLLTQNIINFAAKMSLTPLVIGEDQFFPTGISKIIILDKEGKIKMQIPTYTNEQISLREEWNLLEFRIPVQSAKNVRIKQVIYL